MTRLPETKASDPTHAMEKVLAYARAQGTTGFLIVRDGQVLIERNWPLPPDATTFKAAFAYETNGDGALLEDVASQQKSFVSMLVAIGVDRGVLDIEKPVSDYLGQRWSKATAGQEAEIRLLELLTMTSGLTTDFEYAAPSGATFLYNTPVYAVIKRVVAAAAGRPLEALTRDWLTAPAGMSDTAWRERPAALGDVGNPLGLVTSPRDVARFGQIVLAGGCAESGERIVSEAQLRAMFRPSPANPAYGRLWWLNGARFAIRPPAQRIEGPLIPSAPSDLIAALGALDRKLYISPSRSLIVVRLGQAAPDKNFDEALWARLAAVLD